MPAAGGLWGFVLPFLNPRFDGFTTKASCPQGTQSKAEQGYCWCFTITAKAFQSPLPGFDLRSLGELSLRKKQVLLNTWPGALERSQQESQKSALLGFGGLGPPAARADGFIPYPPGDQELWEHRPQGAAAAPTSTEEQGAHGQHEAPRVAPREGFSYSHSADSSRQVPFSPLSSCQRRFISRLSLMKANAWASSFAYHEPAAC